MYCRIALELDGRQLAHGAQQRAVLAVRPRQPRRALLGKQRAVEREGLQRLGAVPRQRPERDLQPLVEVAAARLDDVLGLAGQLAQAANRVALGIHAAGRQQAATLGEQQEEQPVEKHEQLAVERACRSRFGELVEQIRRRDAVGDRLQRPLDLRLQPPPDRHAGVEAAPVQVLQRLGAVIARAEAAGVANAVQR